MRQTPRVITTCKSISEIFPASTCRNAVTTEKPRQIDRTPPLAARSMPTAKSRALRPRTKNSQRPHRRAGSDDKTSQPPRRPQNGRIPRPRQRFGRDSLNTQADARQAVAAVMLRKKKIRRRRRWHFRRAPRTRRRAKNVSQQTRQKRHRGGCAHSRHQRRPIISREQSRG